MNICWQILTVGLLTAASALAQSPPAQPPGDAPIDTGGWRTDVITLEGKRVIKGLVTWERGGELEVAEIVQKPGRPMYLIVRIIDVVSVVSIERLPDEERAKLEKRIERFRNHALIDAGRRDAVVLTDVSSDNKPIYEYRGQWFMLHSTTDVESTKAAIVRIEQIFRAYRQAIAPQRRPEKPLTIMLFGSMDEYRRHVARLGITLEHAAFFLPERNLIVAGTNTGAFAARLAEVRARHDTIRKQYNLLNKQLNKQLNKLADDLESEGIPVAKRNEEVSARRKAFNDEYQEKMNALNRADRINAAKLEDVLREMMVRLYHEAFHAYLANYVLPENSRLPRWLDEGLAQVFENGQLDEDLLRIDAPNASALKQVKKDLAAAKPMTLKELLSADEAGFVAGHADAKEDSARLYAFSWWLGHQLIFDQGAISAKSLVKAAEASPKRTSFEIIEQLTGQKIPQLEIRWQAEIERLSKQK